MTNPVPVTTLKKVTDTLVKNTGLVPSVATEIEFYLENIHDEKIESFSKDCYRQFGSSGILTHAIEKEEAKGQFEISLIPLPDPIAAAKNTISVKNIITETANTHGGTAIFHPKPYKNLPGSGLHIHVSLHDKSGSNVFQKAIDDNGDEATILCQAIEGLCETMAESMIFFAPNEDSYLRYTSEINESDAKYNHAPVNISWGGNNRTVAIRIPTSTLHPDRRHLEHRVSGADADPYMAIAAVLAGIDYGIENKLPLKYSKIWGNAFDKQYKLENFPRSLTEAKKIFSEGKIIRQYFN